MFFFINFADGKEPFSHSCAEAAFLLAASPGSSKKMEAQSALETMPGKFQILIVQPIREHPEFPAQFFSSFRFRSALLNPRFPILLVFS